MGGEGKEPFKQPQRSEVEEAACDSWCLSLLGKQISKRDIFQLEKKEGLTWVFFIGEKRRSCVNPPFLHSFMAMKE